MQHALWSLPLTRQDLRRAVATPPNSTAGKPPSHTQQRARVCGGSKEIFLPPQPLALYGSRRANYPVKARSIPSPLADRKSIFTSGRREGEGAARFFSTQRRVRGLSAPLSG